MLGYIISCGKIAVDKVKVAALTNLPLPRNVGDVRHVLGVAGFFRKFIPKFSDITAPLARLLRKSVQFKIGPTEEASFTNIIDMLQRAPALRLPDYSKDFYLFCDASNIGISGVLLQYDDEADHEGAI
eukprot:Nk52_evm1s1376 gene=Nk52_evmTU1s1376